MKNILLSLLVVVAVTIALITAFSTKEKCPSDDASFCAQYELAQQGDAGAQFNLGWIYDNGEGIAVDKHKAVRWYRKAAEHGHAKAQVYLGRMYYLGNGGVNEDKHEATLWYRKAAKQGNAFAQFNLGQMYDFGKGVAEDDREAVRWFHKSAEQGDADAQFNLGNMYKKGEGVIEDDLEAVRWYRKAAEQEHAGAQYNLGLMYENGKGVAHDKREAYIWFSIAKANGSKEAADILDKLNSVKLLRTTEIKSARREAARRLEEIDQLIK